MPNIERFLGKPDEYHILDGITPATFKAIVEGARSRGAVIPQTANAYFVGSKSPTLFDFTVLDERSRAITKETLSALGWAGLRINGL